MRSGISIHRDPDGSFVACHPRRGIRIGGPMGAAFAHQAKEEGLSPKEYLFRLLDLWIIVRDESGKLRRIPRRNP